MSYRLPKSAPYASNYLVTWAQNATPVDAKALASMRTFCRLNAAELLVIPGRYQNPTSQWTYENRDHDWWVEEIEPYLFAGRRKIGSHLTVFGDLSISPTRKNPIGGGVGLVRETSAIFGHPKIQLKPLPSGRSKYPRIVTTTGAITVPNYVPGARGKEAEPYHTIGAAVVQRDGMKFHLRHVTCLSDGSFTDLDTVYTPEGARKASRASVLVLGDIHEDASDPAVLDATMRKPGSIMDCLRPEKVYLHDLLHFARRGHHNTNSRHFYDTYHQDTGKKADVREEVENAIKFIDRAIPADSEVMVVRSNHDEAFDRWLEERRGEVDPVNAEFYHWMKWQDKKTRRERKRWTPAFELAYELMSKTHRARFLGRKEEHRVKGIYLQFHGDKGINGSRGSAASYAKLGCKTIIGHSHSPQIQNDCYVVGVTGKLDQGYNLPPSSWLNAHCVVYADGTRTLLFVIDGKWRP